MARTYFSLIYYFHWIFFSVSQFTFSVFTLTGSVTGRAPDVRAASVIASAVNLLKISAAPLEHLMACSRAKLFKIDYLIYLFACGMLLQEKQKPTY